MSDFFSWGEFGLLGWWVSGFLAFQALFQIGIYVGHVKGRKYVMEVVHEVRSPYYDYVDKKAKEAAKFMFPGTTFAVVHRAGYNGWTVWHYLVVDPDVQPLPLRTGHGISRGWCWWSLHKMRMDDEARLFLTRLVLSRTMSPAAMNSISNVMRELA